MPPPVRIKQEPATQPVNLVSSDDTNSPILKRKRLVRTETSNLDAIAGRMETPRKRRRSRALSEEAVKQAVKPALLQHSTSSLSEPDLRAANDDEDRRDKGNHHTEVIAYDFALEADRRTGSDAVLRELSSNVRTLIGTTSVRSIVKRKRTSKANAVGMAMLSEDGEDLSSQVRTPQNQSEGRIHVDRRLETLLDVPSPVAQLLPKRRTPETHTVRREPRIHLPVKQEPDADATPRATFKRPLGLEPSPPPPDPEDEPLRQRPLSSLRLDDFRINPKHMGADYAYSETIRGRDQRRSLQGRGEDFRKAVEIGGLRSGKSDEEALEDYLGPEFATIMGAYGPEKRKEMLIRAHAQGFANEHGKHRHAFERRSTPPGFWRTDMPTTQEAAEDRVRAHELEREKVEERWLEARREGGRWLFRDES